mmetsp:Transcript_22048/g.54468  ORF Transcript_22048/g.54468 Transcript_22048/m.54468 type:complete len:81 (-) Transcript_22048:48-290(-)
MLCCVDEKVLVGLQSQCKFVKLIQQEFRKLEESESGRNLKHESFVFSFNRTSTEKQFLVKGLVFDEVVTMLLSLDGGCLE